MTRGCVLVSLALSAALPAAALNISITLVPSAPFCFNDPDTMIQGQPNSAYSGFLIDLLSRATFSLNSKPPFVSDMMSYTFRSPSNGSYGIKTDGLYNGVVGDLLANVTALAVADLTMTVARATDGVQFTVPFLTSGLGVMTRRVRQPPSMFRFLKPFTTRLWIAVLGAVVAVAVSIWVLDIASPFGYHRTGHHAEKRKLNFPNSAFTSIMNVLKKDAAEPKAVSTRIALLSAIFLVLFLFNAYKAKLNVLVAVKELVPYVSGFADLQQRQLPFAVLADTANVEYFRRSTDPSVIVS